VRFEKAENKGEASDILRYEILYQFGGLYVDTDFECLKPHDILHHYCDFYVGLMADPPGKKRRPEIINSIIGSVPGHPIFKHCLAEISQRETGGQASQILEVTGPKCLTRAFLKLCKEGSYRNVVFPFTYFYPWPNTLRHDPASKEQWIQEETFSVHCWHVSWLKPKQ
jgi:mannosyltransferase OCH1-like enzyme